MKRFFAASVAMIALVCGLQAEDGSAFKTQFTQLSPVVWVHTSWARYAGVPTPSNGLIREGPRSVILVDTAWDLAQTGQVLDFIERRFHKPVAVCFITHSHADRSAGLPLLISSGIKICMNSRTRDLLGLDPRTPGLILQADGPADWDGVAVDSRFPGAAHAPDNITLWFPEDRVLFGGCIIKSADATWIGNVQDADLRSWPKVIAWLGSTYSGAKLVVPGHGASGGFGLLEHTAKLLAAVKEPSRQP